MSLKKINKLEKLLKNLKVKLLSNDQLAGKKLQAVGGRILAIKELKEKDSSKDWSKLIPKDDNEKPKEKISVSSNGQWQLKKHEDLDLAVNAARNLIKSRANLILETLEKASRKTLESMIGSDASMPHHQEAIKQIRGYFPNSAHDVWLTKHYRQNPKLLEDNKEDLAHISAQMKVHDELRGHDVSNMSFQDGLNSLKQKEKELTDKKAKDLENHFYSPSSETTKLLDSQDGISWFDINKPSCGVLGSLCGHCGNTANPHEEDKLLYSGTKHIVNGKEMHKPSSTFIENNGFLGEMKGRHNKKPGEQDYRAIVDLLKSPRIQGIIGGGHEPHNNFALADLPEEMQEEVLRAKPNIDTLASDARLDPDDFPERFQGSIREHNTTINHMKRNSYDPQKIIDKVKSGKISSGDLEAIIRHPKFYDYFNGDHLKQILDHYLSDT
jgi:hypothetical protein